MNFYSNTIYLTNNLNIIYSNYAPFLLTVDPFNISSTLLNNKKIRKIDYIWGDGTTTSILYKPDLNQDSDPKKYPQTKKFLTKDTTISVYNVIIKIYTFESANPKVFNITLNLKNPNINNFFTDFHLVKTRMFGPDNTILYTFESNNRNYIMSSLVNWKLKPKIISNVELLSKPYTLKEPFAEKLQ